MPERIFGVLAAGVVAAISVTAASAACVDIKVPTDFNKIRQNLAGNYCLANDINLGGVSNFAPMGVDVGFSGVFDGRHHTIRNLKITSAAYFVGLFGSLSGTGIVRDVTLQNAQVRARASSTGQPPAGVGILVGLAGSGSSISGVHVTGDVRSSADTNIGGLAGLVNSSAAIVIQRSWSSASVQGNCHSTGYVGGLVGALDVAGLLTQSYATGPVSVTHDSSCILGGLVGRTGGTIRQSFATGPVSALGNDDNFNGNWIGGLAGTNLGSIFDSFASGEVSTAMNAGSAEGGLVGRNQSGKRVHESYALGALLYTSPGATGGLIGAKDVSANVTANSYWDTETTGISHSAGGSGWTTALLQANLPTGWDHWTLTPGVSFPYVAAAGVDFWAPLAITEQDNLLYTFLPISQLDASQYSAPVTYQSKASRSSVFTILARAIGFAQHTATLRNATIDQFFNTTTGQGTWKGPVTALATLGPQLNIAASESLNNSNVIAPLKAHKLVILRGTYTANGKTLLHYMLGTSFTVASGHVTSVVADDPFTGQQVRIDPAASKKNVISPIGFPLANFKVTGFQVVTIKPTA